MLFRSGLLRASKPGLVLPSAAVYAAVLCCAGFQRRSTQIQSVISPPKLIRAMLFIPLPPVSASAPRATSNALFTTKIAAIAPNFDRARPRTRVCYYGRASTRSTTCDRCPSKTLDAHIRLTREFTWPDFTMGLQNGAIRERPRSAISGCIGQKDFRA